MKKILIYLANENELDYILNVIRSNFSLSNDYILVNSKDSSELNHEDLELVSDIVVCLPEWNGSYPWFFKKFVDELPYNSLKGKTVHTITWSSGNNMALSLKHSLLILYSSLKLNISKNYFYFKK